MIIGLTPAVEWVSCRSARIAAVGVPAGGAIAGSWSPPVGSLGLVVVLVTILPVLFWEEEHRRAKCGHRPRSAAELALLRYRLAMAAGRLFPLFLAAVMAGCMYLVYADGHSSGPHHHAGFSLMRAAVMTGLFTAVAWPWLALLCARRFRRRNLGAPSARRGVPWRGWPRLRQQLNHRSAALLAAAVPLQGAAVVADLYEVAWAELLSVVAAAVMCLVLSVAADHRGRLCEDCVREFPVDAPQRAERRRWVLALAHRTVVPLGLVLALLIPVRAFVTGWAPDVVMLVVVPALVVLQQVHHRYIPWCPWCRGGGSGDGGAEVSGPPTGGRGRPLPV